MASRCPGPSLPTTTRLPCATGLSRPPAGRLHRQYFPLRRLVLCSSAWSFLQAVTVLGSRMKQHRCHRTLWGQPETPPPQWRWRPPERYRQARRRSGRSVCQPRAPSQWLAAPAIRRSDAPRSQEHHEDTTGSAACPQSFERGWRLLQTLAAPPGGPPPATDRSPGEQRATPRSMSCRWLPFRRQRTGICSGPIVARPSCRASPPKFPALYGVVVRCKHHPI